MDHEHEHEHEHDHEHHHDHEHPHDHEHHHDHEHPHDHEHHHHSSDAGSAPTPEQLKALLGYMVDHNEHHAEELEGLVAALPAEAQEKLKSAIASFQEANKELRAVWESLR